MARPKGAKNKVGTGSVREQIRNVAHDLRLGGKDGVYRMIEGQMRKAIGTHAIKKVAGVDVVYEELPDTAAARVLLEQLYGRPKETVEIQDPAAQFKGLPQIILVPPAGYGKGK